MEAKLWDQIGFLASVYLSKLSIKSDIICGEAGLSQESEFWMQSWILFIAPLAPLKHVCASLYVLGGGGGRK